MNNWLGEECADFVRAVVFVVLLYTAAWIPG